MTHMVIFRSPEGKPGYHQAEGLDEAMRFAEMLRNQEQVTDARIFRMDEVPIEFKTYYRVEMAAAGSGDAPPARRARGTRPQRPERDTASAAGAGTRPQRPGTGKARSGRARAPEAPEPEHEREAASEPMADVSAPAGRGGDGQDAELEPTDAGAGRAPWPLHPPLRGALSSRRCGARARP